MPLFVDIADSPPTITASGSGPTAVTSSFTPKAGQLVVVMAGAGWCSTPPVTIACSDSGGHTWTSPPGATATGATSGNGGAVQIFYCYFVTSPGAITVTLTYTGLSTGGGMFGDVLLVNGASFVQAGAVASNVIGGSSAVASVTLTPLQYGSRIFGVSDNTSNSTNTWSALANTSPDTNWVDSTDGVVVVAWLNGFSVVPGVAITLGGTWSASNTTSNNVALEIFALPDVGFKATSWHPGKGPNRRARFFQSRRDQTPPAISNVTLTDSPTAERDGGSDGSVAITVLTTGDTPSAHRSAGPSGLGPDVAPAGDSPAAQRSGGADGVLGVGVVLTDSPSAARQAGPDGAMAIGVTLTDSPSAERDYGPDGVANLGVTFGPDTPAAQRSGGADGAVAIDLSITAQPAGLRSSGPDGSLALGVATTDTPSAQRSGGSGGSVFADIGGGVTLTDTPSAQRCAGPDGALVSGVILVGDTPNGTRICGPDGQAAIGVSLTDTPLAERDGGPDGVVIAILSDSPGGLRVYGPDGAMGIALPITGDTPSAGRCGGPVGLVSVGIGSDVIAGTDSPSGARYGGPVGEVLLALLPSKPPYIPVAPLVAPSYALWVADTRTGRMLWELPAETFSWNSKLNDIGTLSAALSVESSWDALSDQDERDPRTLLREVITGPWRFSLVLKWGNNAVWAGPYISMSRLVPNRVDLNGAEIGKFFTKRALIKPGAISAVDPTADTSFGPNATKPHVAAALVSQALVGTGYNLPIIVTDPGGSGLDARVYYGSELAKYWDKLQALMAEVDGPEIRFDPQVTAGSDGDYVSWVMQIGDPYLGRSGTAWTFDSDINTIVGMNVDGSNMALNMWSVGSGQSRDRLVAQSADTTLLNIGWPMLDEVDSSHSSEINYPVLAAHNVSALSAYKNPVVSLQVSVPADADPMAGTYRVGDDYMVDVRNDPIIRDGLYNRRIAAISGTEKPWVAITDVGPLPLAAIGPITTVATMGAI